MKKILLAFLLSLLMPFSFGEGYKVLFIGNSYTYVNNLPEMIASMAESLGDTLVFSSSVPGGSTFQMHVNNSTTVSLIQQGGWDYVVLQGQSQEPSFPDGQFYAETYPYAQQLCEMINQYNPEATTVFYMTWGRKNGDQGNCPYFPPLCTYEGMDSLLYLRYMTMAEDFGAEVSPVGALWHYLRDHNPDIDLYSSDESHPSLAGTYAAACSFYSVLFRANPRDLTYHSSLPEEVAETIRVAAQKVIYDSLGKWFVELPDTTDIPGSSVSLYPNNRCVLYPNPASEYVDIQSDDFISFLKVYTEDGRLVSIKENVNESKYRLSLSGYNKGFYFIQIIDNKGNIIRKQLIKK